MWPYITYIFNLMTFRFVISWRVYVDSAAFNSKIRYYFQQNEDSMLSGKAFSGEIDVYNKVINDIESRGCFGSGRRISNASLKYQGSEPVVVSLKISSPFCIVMSVVLSLFSLLQNPSIGFFLTVFLVSYFFITVFFYFEVFAKWSGIHDMLLLGNVRVERIKIKENNC